MEAQVTGFYLPTHPPKKPEGSTHEALGESVSQVWASWSWGHEICACLIAVCPFIWVLVIPAKAFARYLLSTLNSHGEGMSDTWQKSLTEFLKGLTHWRQPTQTKRNAPSPQANVSTYSHAVSNIQGGIHINKMAFDLFAVPSICFPWHTSHVCYSRSGAQRSV